MDKPLLHVENITKTYGQKTALQDVSLSIPKGSIYGLLGPNGAGKTSLIRIINQISYPDKGQIFLDGQPLQPHHIKDIGYMPEERGLYKSMKVGEQAVYLAQLKGMSKADAKKQLTAWFEKFGIMDWWDKKIQELSKGMAQKVQFIVTVLHQPKLLIFDEPFSGFDPVNANLIKDEILKLRKQGSTIIFSTHRMESVEEMCDEIALINLSKKIIEGSLMEVKKQYRTFVYWVGVKTDREGELKRALQNYQINETTFKSLDKDWQFSVELGEKSPSELLQTLLAFGEVTHFSEQIPSVNEIFIKAVSQ